MLLLLLFFCCAEFLPLLCSRLGLQWNRDQKCCMLFSFLLFHPTRLMSKSTKDCISEPAGSIYTSEITQILGQKRQPRV